MAKTDIQTNLRLPEEMKVKLSDVAKQNNRSLNAEVVARLQESLVEPSGILPASIAEAIKNVADKTGSSVNEALLMTVVSGLNLGAPSVLYVNSKKTMTLKEVALLLDSAKKYVPDNATIILENFSIGRFDGSVTVKQLPGSTDE